MMKFSGLSQNDFSSLVKDMVAITAMPPYNPDNNESEHPKLMMNMNKNSPHEVNSSNSSISSNNCNDMAPTTVNGSVTGVDYTERDVLLGRGGAVNRHVGNRVYRRLIEHQKGLYRDLQRKEEKNILIKSVFRALTEQGARFLKKDEASGKWYQVDESDALGKISQALRESCGSSNTPTTTSVSPLPIRHPATAIRSSLDNNMRSTATTPYESSTRNTDKVIASSNTTTSNNNNDDDDDDDNMLIEAVPPPFLQGLSQFFSPPAPESSSAHAAAAFRSSLDKQHTNMSSTTTTPCFSPRRNTSKVISSTNSTISYEDEMLAEPTPFLHGLSRMFPQATESSSASSTLTEPLRHESTDKFDAVAYMNCFQRQTSAAHLPHEQDFDDPLPVSAVADEPLQRQLSLLLCPDEQTHGLESSGRWWEQPLRSIMHQTSIGTATAAADNSSATTGNKVSSTNNDLERQNSLFSHDLLVPPSFTYTRPGSLDEMRL